MKTYSSAFPNIEANEKLPYLFERQTAYAECFTFHSYGFLRSLFSRWVLQSQSNVRARVNEVGELSLEIAKTSMEALACCHNFAEPSTDRATTVAAVKQSRTSVRRFGYAEALACCRHPAQPSSSSNTVARRVPEL